MKRRILIIAVVVSLTTFFTSCLKTDNTPRCTSFTIDQDKHAIDSIMGSSIDLYSFDSQTGLYYKIEDEGSGEHNPTIDSLVSFKYIGRILSNDGTGAIIDSLTIAPPANYKLSYYANLIFLSYALPKVKKGGTISVIIPSSQLFGCTAMSGVNPIPSNSQLIYRYTLTDLKLGY